MPRKRTHRVRMTEEEMEMWHNIKGNEFIAEQLSQLQEECNHAGIPIEDVRSYWYKSDHYSIFAKNKVKTYEEVKDDIIQDLDGYSPVYPKIERNKVKEGHLLVIDPADPHFGKYASESETGAEYNLETSKKRVIEGVQSILNHASGFDIDQILFIFGNDALHIDQPHRKTTAGTPQDTDGMWHEAIQYAKDSYVTAIEMMMQVADVHALYCPSNHDYASGYFLADILNSWFRLSENVTFDSSIRHRKYFQYGQNMIEADHGDGCKLKDTPMLMATEQPIMWSECKFRYSYKHHIHHSAKYGDTIGVNIESLRSLSGADGWHDRNGYVSMPAIQGFVHGKNTGRVGSFCHYY